MFSLLFVRTLCLFQPLLSFVLLFGFLLCCFDFPSPLFLFLGIHFITLGLFFSFFLSLSLPSTLCIIIHGLFCFDLYALVDRVLFDFFFFILLLLFCVVLFGGIIRFILFILWGNVDRAGRWYGFCGTWKRHRKYSQYLNYDSTILIKRINEKETVCMANYDQIS